MLLRASWQWSCVKYVSRSDSMSRSWTACLKVRHSGSLIVLTKHERACMQSCYGRLGSDRVTSMFQHQTVCLEVGHPVSKLDDLLTGIGKNQPGLTYVEENKSWWSTSCVRLVKFAVPQRFPASWYQRISKFSIDSVSKFRTTIYVIYCPHNKKI